MPKQIKALLARQSIKLFGDGECTSESRNMVFVKYNFLVHINVKETFFLIKM